ncbi:MAG: sugar phosphate isomerase/epimerase family protein [Pirellulaceae bacterium]
MHAALDRRKFLRACQAGVVAGIAAGASGTTPLGRCTAAEPIQRTGTAKFKLSLAAYSYRSLLDSKSSGFTLFDFADDCAKMQLDGTELTSYYFPADVQPEYLRKLKAHCFRLGLDVSGTAVGNDFGHPDGPQRQQQIASLKKWIDHAEVLGAPTIRIFAGHVKKGVTPDEAHRLMVSAMEECCAYAGERGIYLGLENHGGPTDTAAGLLKLVRDVQSPWLGVNVDTGNFHSNDVYADIAQIAPYAVNVQVKVVVRRGDKQEPMDFGRLAKILREVGYRGYVVLEYEEKDDPREACPRYMDKIRAAFA